MFPVFQPSGVVTPGPVPKTDPVVVTSVVGVEPVALDPHAPRAAAPQIDATRAQATSVQPEPLNGAMPGAVSGNRAAQLSPDLQWLMQCLQALGSPGEGEQGRSAMVRWPAPGEPVASTPAEALQRLRDSLGRSALFAANPHTPAALAAATARVAAADAPGASAVNGVAPAGLDQSGSMDGAANPGPTEASARSAVAGEVDTTRQALQLLLHGRLQWSGELTPGVQARLSREEAWEEDPRQPGKLLSGSALRLEIDLPTSGPLVVLARQVGEHMDLRLLPDPRHAPRFESALADLRSALAQLTDRPIDLQMQVPMPARST
jgi:hypothetical protein